MKRAIFLALLLGVSLTACEEHPDPKYGWWRMQCVRSHEESGVRLLPMGGSMGMAFGGIPIGSGLSLQPYTETVCDEQAPYCPAGRECAPEQRPR